MRTNAARNTARIVRLPLAPVISIVALSSFGLWTIILVAAKFLAHNLWCCHPSISNGGPSVASCDCDRCSQSWNYAPLPAIGQRSSATPPPDRMVPRLPRRALWQSSSALGAREHAVFWMTNSDLMGHEAGLKPRHTRAAKEWRGSRAPARSRRSESTPTRRCSPISAARRSAARSRLLEGSFLASLPPSVSAGDLPLASAYNKNRYHGCHSRPCRNFSAKSRLNPVWQSLARRGVATLKLARFLTPPWPLFVRPISLNTRRFHFRL